MTKNKTISQITTELACKKYSVTELIKEYLDRIKSENPKLNAFITITEKEALQEAQEADKTLSQNPNIFLEKPLLGVPLAHKDLFLTKNIKTTAGSRLLENYLPQYSATVVKKLSKAGAISLGKLNCDAWAHGASGENSDFGPTINPADPTRVSGGSSSGSAAAVAADLVTFATGTDTGGSTRQPACFCGVIGLKPTYGRVSRSGIVAMASSLDSIGHLTQNVYDSALVLETTAGPDPYDATSSNLKVEEYTKLLKKPVEKLKIGIIKEYQDGLTDHDVAGSFALAKSTLEKMNCQIKEISLPHTKYSVATYYIIMPAEVSSNLARYDGLRYGHTRDLFGDEAKRRIMIGTYTLSSGYYDAYYLRAMKVRQLIKADFSQAFADVDIILSPVAPTPAFKLGEKTNDPLSMYLSDIYTVTANLAGIPGIAIPTGKNSSNLPLGVQFLANHFQEAKLFNLAYQFEQHLHA